GREYTPQLVRPIVRDAARDDVRRLLAERGISGSERIIIIHPAGGGSAPVWPAERFAELAPRLAAEPGTRIVVTGTAAERDVCRRVAESDVSVIDLCGCCSLDGMMALCERATLLVANSTGVLHIAAALGTRVVGIFPSTPSMSAKRWGPFAASARTVASGAFAPHTDLDNCSFIPVQRVLDLCTESLSDTLS
ncbi:MAG: glycosyltransferase family 9 protein, partial [Candidatus Kapaibacterium sp.]